MQEGTYTLDVLFAYVSVATRHLTTSYTRRSLARQTTHKATRLKVQPSDSVLKIWRNPAEDVGAIERGLTELKDMIGRNSRGDARNTDEGVFTRWPKPAESGDLENDKLISNNLHYMYDKGRYHSLSAP